MERKWMSEAGPRQTKQVSKALGAFTWRSKGVICLEGVIGGKERRTMLVAMYGEPCEGYTAALAAIMDRFCLTITRDNYRDIVRALDTATAALVLPEEDRRSTMEDALERERRIQASDRKIQERETVKEALWEAMKKKAPAKAFAVILATLVEDKSDSMTDYYGSTVKKTVAIGFRTGKREDFRQLRKAAAGFAETAHLGPGQDEFIVWEYDSRTNRHRSETRKVFTSQAQVDAWISDQLELPPELEWSVTKESFEHRENYSMGGGNYLKAGGRHSNGWKVKSFPLECRAPMLDEDRTKGR